VIVVAVLKFAGLCLLALVIAGLLAAVIVPRFLDRVYYRGPVSDHFDGERFFNPDGDADTLSPTAGQPGRQRGGRLGFLWRQFTERDGRPPWPETVAVTPAKPEPRVEGDRMVATWVGHATVLVQTQGLNILTDPVWSDRVGPFGIGPKRVAAPGIAFDDLPRIDLVLLSHNHYDHLDLDTLRRLWARDQPRIVTPLGNDSILRTRGIASDALDWGGRAVVAPQVEVAVVRAHHWDSRWFTDRNRALWGGFVVRLPGGNLYFTGDTGLGDGRWPAEAAALGPVRLALIPVGAFRFRPGQMSSGSHIGPGDAALAFERSGASAAIPVHWGTFRLSSEGYDTPPRLLALALECLGGDAAARFRPAAIGRAVEVLPYSRPGGAGGTMPDAMRRCLDTPAARALP